MGDASPSAPLPKSSDVQEKIVVSTSSTTTTSGLSHQVLHSPQTHPSGSPSNAFSSQLHMPQSQGNPRPIPYNMGSMAGALPQTGGYRASGYPTQALTGQPIVGQMPPVSQFPAGQQYYIPQQPQIPAHYGTPLSPSQQPANLAAQPQYFGGQVVGAPQPHIPAGYCCQHGAHYQPQQHVMPNQYQHSGHRDPRAPSNVDKTPLTNHSEGGKDSPGGRQGIVRGPPRKPKQSGHAIWIGNLPPQTNLMQLVHHVCRETSGLESLFLISKSNCAFANFGDEAACVAAQQNLHDSKFQNVKLVSRLRKSTVEGAAGVTAPTGPAAVSGSSGSSATRTRQENPKTNRQGSESPKSSTPISRGSSGGELTPQKDKFFILKSLTVEDLESSVRTGKWATQSHNEGILNNAFKTADNVYLIFSANKSGEYFGYARMTSEINNDPEAAIEFAPKAPSAVDMDLPRSIPTEATEFAPKGRIIDDSARGTIFWEAERESGMTDGADAEEENESGSVKSDSETPKAWGKPFNLEWLSTSRLPFYRTRGLRNPLNSNREVKIARDGTELEPSVGRRLIGLFNSVQSPAQIVGGMQPHQGMATIVTGYPPLTHPPPAVGMRAGY